jgi:hypothetical protein
MSSCSPRSGDRLPPWMVGQAPADGYRNPQTRPRGNGLPARPPCLGRKRGVTICGAGGLTRSPALACAILSSTRTSLIRSGSPSPS